LKRFPIERRVRLGIIAALALLVLVPAVLTYRAFDDPTTKVFRVPLWGWVHWAEWDYSVFLKPNSTQDSEELGPGSVYYENLVEGIEARFSYNFTTDSDAQIDGWYNITADLVAGDLLRERTLLVPRTPFDSGDSSRVNLTFEIAIDRAAQLARIEEMADEKGIRADDDPTVTYTAHVEAEAFTETERVKQIMDPNLVVPLTGETFTLSGNRTPLRNGVVRIDEERPINGVDSKRRNLIVATVILVFTAPLFAMATVAGVQRDDALAREAQRIRRKYRKRISDASPGSSGLPGQEVVAVGSIADLLRVSEELLKPIIYCELTKQGEQHVFYTVDGLTRYQYTGRPITVLVRD